MIFSGNLALHTFLYQMLVLSEIELRRNNGWLSLWTFRTIVAQSVIQDAKRHGPQKSVNGFERRQSNLKVNKDYRFIPIKRKTADTESQIPSKLCICGFSCHCLACSSGPLRIPRTLDMNWPMPKAKSNNSINVMSILRYQVDEFRE